MEAAAPHNNLGELIHRLKQLHAAHASDNPDFAGITGDLISDLERFRDGVFAHPASGYLARIVELEEEVHYLEELTMSQRMMMEDIVKHLLEVKSNRC